MIYNNSMRINFEKLEIFNDIEGKSCSVVNVKKDLANMVYNGAFGLPFHALAIKIYNSVGETEYSEEECDLIRKFVAERCTPAFYDAIERLFKGKEE